MFREYRKKILQKCYSFNLDRNSDRDVFWNYFEINFLFLAIIPLSFMKKKKKKKTPMLSHSRKHVSETQIAEIKRSHQIVKIIIIIVID